VDSHCGLHHQLLLLWPLLPQQQLQQMQRRLLPSLPPQLLPHLHWRQNPLLLLGCGVE
jgi:hypothetical protein